MKAGAGIVFEVHYTPNGKATTDRTKLGLIFAKEPPKERVLTLSAVNGTFKIPPGDPTYKVDASFDAVNDVKLARLPARTHRRGQDFPHAPLYPPCETET